MPTPLADRKAFLASGNSFYSCQSEPESGIDRIVHGANAEDGAPGDGSQPDGRRDGQRTSGNDPKTRPSIGERLDELLDRPFFDPEERGEDEPGLLRRFRAAFDSDPESASTLFVGLYFAVSDIAPLIPLLCVTLVLLAFAQQGVRLWKHCYAMPDSLCPWDVGLPGGDAYTAKAFSDLMNF
ncbi:hypothetical protein EMIHUDRAFT_226679 [Emiliania huxleyi CCMP1516]|uniref:Uncharacterized protein n=2 Tax=Emiliania huxleyi TaxID=2903 RepID=A0A0D3KK35_EMIH1|nr:hypothetical protein EMIHUDRAFT_226679 [Emiliania huxleyi CCMP1516]EOD36120.1 hypothetical protein EMIHUDRAFT_226679 [Emiliania huxleyi CCMP1516]|eukprot:XP_005788549.1 hypothetical protein EMIHUDRAFT_226679 [Emiliania huxleyi CCMP1516]